MADDVLKTLREKDIKNFKKLFKKPDVKDNLNAQHGAKLTTFLHEACKHGHDKIARHLIEKGVELEVRTCNGWTPLHKAAAWCQVECVQVLIESGAEVNSETEAGNTPLHLATQNTAYIYHKDMLNKKDTEDIQKQNYKNCFNVMKLLLSTMAPNVDAKNYLGRTPLHNAACQGHLHAVALLVDKEADVNVKDNRKKTAIDLARANNQHHLVEWFKEYEIHEERLARQDLARFASSEHSRLEKRLLELAEEHEGELAEQRAQLLQAYKVDQEILQAAHDVTLAEELAKKDTVVTELNSLVKAERQNMDNDYMTYHKQVIHLQQVLHDLNIEKHAHLKFIQELEVQLQESESRGQDQEASLTTMSADLQQLREEMDREGEEHKLLTDSMVAQHMEQLLLLQQDTDSLQEEISTQREVTEGKQRNVEQLEEQLRSLQSELSESQKLVDSKEQEMISLSSDLESKKSELEVTSAEFTGLKSELSSTKQKHQEVQIQFQQVLKEKETELAKLNEDNAKCGEQISQYKTQEEVLQQTQATLQKLTADNTSLVEQRQQEIDSIDVKHAAILQNHAQHIEKYKTEKQGFEQQNQELLTNHKLELDTLVKSHEQSLQIHEELMQKERLERDSLVQKYEGSIQKLQNDNELTQRQQQESVQQIQAEKTTVEQKYKEDVSTLQAENKRKGSEFQQKLTEKDKELIIATTQLKHQSDTLRSLETNQQQDKQKHQAELRQLETRLTTEHQAVINKFKSDLANQHQEEVVQIQKCLKEQHTVELGQREGEVREQNKRELAKIQQEFANKESNLQQEMFRIAGAEQNKLKQQHSSQLEKMEATHRTEVQALNQKLREASNRALQHDSLVQSSRQEMTEQSHRHQAELDRISAQEQQQLNKTQQDFTAKESELICARNQLNELNQKVNNLEASHSQQLGDFDQKMAALRAEHSQEVAGLQARESQMTDKHRAETAKVEQKFTTEQQELQQALHTKEEELTAKVSDLKQQDDIIKSYVKENTDLKDQYCQEIAELQATVDQLQMYKTEASQWEEKYEELNCEMTTGEIRDVQKPGEKLCNGHDNFLNEEDHDAGTNVNGGNLVPELNSDENLINI